MRAKRHMHVCDGITGSIAPTRNRCFKCLQRLLTAVHPSISDRQTKSWPSSEFSCLFVERNCIVEASHLAIQRRECRLTIMGKCWIKLECALSGRGCLVVETEITVELAREITHPKRGRIDSRCALQVGQGLVAIAPSGGPGGDKKGGWSLIRI